MHITDSIYFRFFNLLPKDLKIRVFLLAPLLGFAGVLEVASLAALVPLMSFILTPESNSEVTSFLELEGLSVSETAGLLFLIFFSLVFIKGLFVFFVYKYTFSTALQIKADLQKKLFSWYVSKDYAEQMKGNSAEYLRNISTECHQIEGRLVMPGLTLLAELIPVIFVGIFLLYINPEGVLLAALILFVTAFLITKYSAEPLKKYGTKQLHSDGMQIKVAKESFSALKEIKLYKRQLNVVNLFAKYVDSSISLICKALVLGQVPKFVLEIMALLVIGVIAAVSFQKGASVNDVLIELTVFIGAVVKLLPSSNRIIMNLQSLTHAKPAVQNALHELQGVEETDYVPNPMATNKQLGSFNSIIFENVSFAYPKRQNHIFNNVDLEINKGEVVGLVGETGTGKSTLIDLILGLIEPSSGTVRINGIDVRLCSDDWHDKIAYVPQSVVLFDDSLRNNILFFNDASMDVDDEQLEKILSALQLDKLLASLPDGLDTVVGEGGSSLSGGQKQRIGIARALVRSPEFIILDEATSALDIDTEKAINDLILSLKPSCSVLIIAHRPTALEVCDYIYKIRNSALIERLEHL
jgi:ABC-type multidrug transport system fused ATPase/permease subunit